MVRQHKRTFPNDDESEPLRATIARMSESLTLLLSQCMPRRRAPTQHHYVQRSTVSESVCPCENAPVALCTHLSTNVPVR